MGQDLKEKGNKISFDEARERSENNVIFARSSPLNAWKFLQILAFIPLLL